MQSQPGVPGSGCSYWKAWRAICTESHQSQEPAKRQLRPCCKHGQCPQRTRVPTKQNKWPCAPLTRPTPAFPCHHLGEAATPAAARDQTIVPPLAKVLALAGDAVHEPEVTSQLRAPTDQQAFSWHTIARLENSVRGPKGGPARHGRVDGPVAVCTVFLSRFSPCFSRGLHDSPQ